METVRAVDGVSLAIRPGDVVALIGASGSGKSTLARLLLRLIEPTAGRVMFDGLDLSALAPGRLRTLRRRMQIIFQDASLDPCMKAVDQVAEPLLVHRPGAPAVEARERARGLLDEVGLQAAHADSYPHELSGGQCQRVSIARALALDPDFLVADEPVSALDPTVAFQVVSLLQEVQERRGMAMLVISHDMRLARRISRRTLVMDHGTIVEEGDTEDHFRSPTQAPVRTLVERDHA